MKIDRGVTKLTAHGGYTDFERPILMCVVDQAQFMKLKGLVQIDRSVRFCHCNGCIRGSWQRI